MSHTIDETMEAKANEDAKQRAIKEEDKKTIAPLPGEKQEDILDTLSDEFKAQFESYLPSKDFCKRSSQVACNI